MKVLIICAHPDDEALGCGGTIARHVALGDDVQVLFLSEGVTSRFSSDEDVDEIAKIVDRESFAFRAADILKFKIIQFFRYPNLRMSGVPMLDMVKSVDTVIRDLEPDLIYTHHSGDMNSDHRIVFEIVLTACRPRDNFFLKGLYCFEIPSSTEWSSPLLGAAFVPNRFVDITPYFSLKMSAIDAYAYEMRDYPHPRSLENIKALAQFRGASCGIELAEAFMVVRDCQYSPCL